jgi:pimeloyl-[acyl-carrier protein] methyl ester esterase
MKYLILLHGWGASGRIWQRQVEAFGDRYTVLTPRISEWNAAWLTDFWSGLPEIDPRESILVGWSLGGMLLLEALAQGAGLAPAATVLVGVAPVFCQRPGHPWGQSVASVRAMRLGLRSDPARVLTDFLASCLAPGEESFRDEAAAGFDFTADPAHLAQGLDYLRDKDLGSLLWHIPGPVAIVQGEQDGIVDPAQAQFLQEHLPGSSLHILPGAGHLPFLTQAEAFNDILRGLISNDAHEPLPRKSNPPKSPFAKGGL